MKATESEVDRRQWWYPPHTPPWLFAAAPAAALDVIVEVVPGPYVDDVSPDAEGQETHDPVPWRTEA